MKYVLKRNLLTDSVRVDLTEAEYAGIAEARSTVLAALSLEHLFEMLLKSFQEVEELIALVAIRHSMCFDYNFSYASSVGAIEQFAHRITNFLSCSTMYRDRSKKFANSEGGAELKNDLNARYSQEFDENFAFMVCEGLRNHTLHAGTCVHRLDSNYQMVVAASNELLSQHIVVPQVNLKQLEENENFRPKTLEAMRQSSRKRETYEGVLFDLPPLLREYMSGMARVHHWLRSTLAELVALADKCIAQRVLQFEDFRDNHGSDGLGIIVLNDNYVREEGSYLYISLDPINLRRTLVAKNAHPVSFEKVAFGTQPLKRYTRANE